MADNDAENIFQSSSSRPFTVRGGFPFVFLPSAFTEGFTFVDHPGDASSTDEQETTEPEQKKPDEAAPNKEEEQEEEEDNDERDRSEKNDDGIDRSNDVRISQPKYSQLLRELDFGKARMVDVTEILSKDLESSANNTSPDDNEQENKTTTDESTTSTVEDQQTDQAKPEDEEQLRNAADEIQNDLNNLAAIIQAAAQISTVDDEKHPPSPMVKKPTFDEDDDTSKQATQNYDLHDYEQERGKAVVTERSTIEKEEQEDVSPTTAVTWDQLVYGEATKKEPVSSDNVVQADESKEKDQVDGGASAPTTEEFPRGFRRISDSPSSNTESVVERENDRGSNDRRASSSSSQMPAGPTEDEAKESSVRRMPAGTERQDSQGTLIDENLDDLTSQLKQVLFDQERQTLNTSTKEERTTDGIGSMSFPLSTPDKLSTDLADENARRRKFADLRSNDPTKEFLHRTTAGTNDHPQRLSSSKKRTHHRHHHHRSVERDHPSNLRQSDDNWLNMLEKLEREHRLRLEQQQHQYEHYMHDLEEKMQRRFDEYLTLTSGLQESRLHNYEEMSPLHRTHTSMPIDTNIGRYKTHSTRPSERPVVKDIISHYYPADSTLNILSSNKRRSTSSSTAFPRSQSKDDLVHARAELSARHAKHLADLKSYEDEINEIRDQINRTKMGHGSSVTRQSMETIERINNDNVRLHDEINDLRHNLKITQDENLLLKRQLEDLRDQITNKDFELKNYHRTIADLEQQITQAENTKERQDEKFRHADRQSLLYREENEKLKIDLNLTRDRLVRLEERYRELEAENETLRRQAFKADHEHRPTSRVIDDMKFNSNLPSARDYGRFHLSTSRHSSSTLNASRDTHLETPRYTTNGSDALYRQDRSPRPMTRISDYLNDPPAFPPPYIPPTKAVYSPRKTSPNRRRYGSSNLRSSLERPAKPSEQLEQKFDQLLKRKRDLEARMSRIPTRHLTSADRQLYDVLEREIARVEQQIASVKLELRKLNVFPVHKI